MSSFDPEGPVAQVLRKSLAVELVNKFNIADDADDVSEFILVLIGSNKTSAEIASEVKELVDIPIDEGFINTVFMEIQRIMNEQSSQQEVQPPSQQVQFVSTPAAPAAPAASAPASESALDGDRMSSDRPDIPMDIPKGPRGVSQGYNNAGRGGRKGGISKNFNKGNAKPHGVKNAAKFDKVLAMSSSNVSNMKQFIQKAPKGRCTAFPYCNNKDCEFSHPTKLCFAYPNCKNPPGTCNYLHPGEDDRLMEELDKTRKVYLESKKKSFEPAGNIGLCKFGMLCSKDICPFGHPTPSNKDARVTVLQWCPSGKNCADSNCPKAHPSPNYHPPVEEKPKFTAPEPILEQCKYGPACTNFKCNRRHATTTVPCREGVNCTRLNCYFSHPIDEDCRFGIKCTNKTCMYRHPEGRTLPSNIWVKDASDQHPGSIPTNQRVFAVPDDQIMEHAVQQT